MCNKTSIIWIALLSCPLWLLGQSDAKSDCEKKFKEAREKYNSGYLDEVRMLLADFQKCRQELPTDKVNEGYEMLITALIYVDEDSLAEAHMKEFLRYNPIYQPDKNKADFYHLYQQYRIHPVFAIGGRIGLGDTKIHMREHYSLNDEDIGTDTKRYDSFALNFKVGITMDIPMGDSPFELGVEPNFFTRSYNYQHDLVSTLSLNNESPAFSKLSFSENQSWLGGGVLLRYYPLRKFIRNKKQGKNSKQGKWGMTPYLYGGAEPSYLIDAKLKNVVRNLTDINGEYEGAMEDAEIFLLSEKKDNVRYPDQAPMRTRFNTSLFGGVGFMQNLGEFRIGLDIRFSWMLFNQVVAENRYSHRRLLYIYSHLDDDFTMSDINISLSFQKRIFNIKKKKR